MAKELTQKEMDELLQSVPIREKQQDSNNKDEFEVGGKSIKVYNFKQTSRLSRESKRIIENIHDSFAKELAIFLSEKLRSEVLIRFIAVSQMYMSELLDSIESPTCLYVFQFQDQKRSAVFEFVPQFIFFALDKLLGGPGKTLDNPRELTRIEQKISNELNQEILDILASSWKTITPVRLQFQNYYSNPNYLHFVESGEGIAHITFEAAVGDDKYLISLSYPYFLIEMLIPSLEKDEPNQRFVSTPKESAILHKHLNNTSLPVFVKLGETKISVEELLNLQVGDVLLLEKGTDKELELGIGSRSCFSGKAGIINNRLAFKVLNRIR